jgi:hypothetical protein
MTKCDHIMRLITLTSDNIKQLLLFISFIRVYENYQRKYDGYRYNTRIRKTAYNTTLTSYVYSSKLLLLEYYLTFGSIQITRFWMFSRYLWCTANSQSRHFFNTCVTSGSVLNVKIFISYFVIFLTKRYALKGTRKRSELKVKFCSLTSSLACYIY